MTTKHRDHLLLPDSIVVSGQRLFAIGKGKFPYECTNKDDHPDAMIYQTPIDPFWKVWTSSTSPDFLGFRDKSLDTYPIVDQHKFIALAP